MNKFTWASEDLSIFLPFTDSPRYNNMESELDCWMEWIENSMAEAAFDTQSSDDFDNFIGGTLWLKHL